jgi:hypothetical protein
MNQRGLYVLAFLLQMLAFAVITELNYSVAQWAVALHLDAVLVLFAGLYFPALPGLLLTSLVALFVGATRPLTSGLSLFLFLTLWLFTLMGRKRIRRERWSHLAGLAIATQVVEIAILAMIHGIPEAWSTLGYLKRMGSDTLLSILAIALLAPFWVRFQARLFTSFGWSLENEVTHS